MCEKQLTALHVVRIFPLFNRCVSILLTKMRIETKTVPLTFLIFSTFRGVQTLIFTYVPYIVIGLQEEPANFYREKRSVAFVTGHLFTFLMVLSLICLVTTQILVSENRDGSKNFSKGGGGLYTILITFNANDVEVE